MTDAIEIFNRILQTLGAKNAPQAARILGLAKQSVYEWREKIPSLENLIKIAESGNTSLDWLITGKEQVDPLTTLPQEDKIAMFKLWQESMKKKPTLEDMFEAKIREIIREELSKYGIISKSQESVIFTGAVVSLTNAEDLGSVGGNVQESTSKTSRKGKKAA